MSIKWSKGDKIWGGYFGIERLSDDSVQSLSRWNGHSHYQGVAQSLFGHSHPDLDRAALDFIREFGALVVAMEHPEIDLWVLREAR